jgi:glycerophosphoryl diester phosphodiesterase
VNRCRTHGLVTFIFSSLRRLCYSTVVELVWHMARGARDEAGNTPEGITAALRAGATRIEIDVRPIGSGEWVLVHDGALPDGRGVRELSTVCAQTAGLPSLRDAVARINGSAATLQIDLKEERLLSAAETQSLVDSVAPLGDAVVVGSMIDWNLRALRAAAPHVPLAFDPLIYFHHWEERPIDVLFPRQRGAYGYWDDHPLAIAEFLPRRDYLAARFGSFAAAVRGLSEVMIHWPTLARAMDDGLDVAGTFHAHGILVVAWTLDADMPDADRVFERLAAAGVDALVTNTARVFSTTSPKRQSDSPVP